MNNHLIHCTAGRSGRLATQSPRTGYEPNTTGEISCSEVTLIHPPSRRTSFCSVYNSGEDATTTLVSSEVDETQSIGRPLLMQKREACAVPTRIHHSTGKSSMSSSSHTRSAGRPVAVYSHKRKSSRDPRSAQETYTTSERIRTEQQEVRYHLNLQADEAAEGEKAALSRLSVADFHTRLLLEEQRNRILSEAGSELKMQELKAESTDIALRELNRQIHSPRKELYHTKSGICKHTERTSLTPSRIGKPRKSKSINSSRS